VIALVRHGQTDANRDGLLLGRADVALNDAGRAQAMAAANALGEPPVVVVTSPLTRCVDSARVIAQRWGCDVHLDDRLVEIDYGEWDERALGDVPEDAWAQWREDPEFAPPGGESLAAVHARVEQCARELLDESGVGLIAAVSHVSPIKAAAAWALGGGPELSWRLRLDVGSISRITRGPAGALLLTWNEVPGRASR
jgi:broad specificity phosphatase PhoE